ncbi:MAG: Hpt domain-containing protein [Candidatus Electrothrix sp. ATG2]|nr:Hpt domain-containing protein [Candidatus Electrothrix sp. ATG2]
MNDIITKPIDPPSFCRTLECWLPDKPIKVNKTASRDTQASRGTGQDELRMPTQPKETHPPLLDNPVILQAFVHNHDKTVERIHTALAEENLDEAYRQAHNLKSAAGAIRAPQLNRLSEELEKRLSHASAVNTNFEADLVAQIEMEHRKVLERIARYQA